MITTRHAQNHAQKAPPMNDMALNLFDGFQAKNKASDLRYVLSCNSICCMRRDSRLSGVLHVLLHMAEANGPVTSEAMAQMMQTNPVVIRRILAGLREQGFVSSEKGHGGGWQLSCDLNTVTLYDIYVALEAPTILAIGNRSESPNCLVEEAVNMMMNQAFRDAEALLLARLREVTLAELSQDVHQRLQERGFCSGQKVDVKELLELCESEAEDSAT